MKLYEKDNKSIRYFTQLDREMIKEGIENGPNIDGQFFRVRSPKKSLMMKKEGNYYMIQFVKPDLSEVYTIGVR